MKRVLLPIRLLLLLFLWTVLASFSSASSVEDLRFENCPEDFKVKPVAGLNIGVGQWTAPNVVGGEGEVEVNRTHRPGAFLPLGITVVTYTAIDEVGNTATCTFQINVSDEEDEPDTQTCRTRDSLVLVDLYQTTNGTSWTVKWNLAQPIDTWYGIRLNESGCVIDIRLERNNLSGVLPTSLGSLSDLYQLSLSNNKLSGSIPSSIEQLSNLEGIFIHNNQLTGTLELDWSRFSVLEYINLSNNQLEGEIPKNIGNLPELKSLAISKNKLIGSIPEEIGRLTTLEGLSLDHNELSGSIPATIGNLLTLTSLDLQYNAISGMLPSSITNLAALRYLNLRFNEISGKLPDDIGDMRSLETVYLSFNQFNGALPPSIGQLKKLSYFNIQVNEFSGSFPSGLYELTALENIFFGSNRFNGTMDAAIEKLQQLEVLDISNNELVGTIPATIGALKMLTQINLGINKLTGSIPKELATLPKLSYINLSSNQLSGCYAQELKSLCGVTVDFRVNIELPNRGNFESFCENGVGGCEGEDISCRSLDSLSLVDIYNITDGAHWKTTWNLEEPLEDWYGVSLDSDGCVKELDLSSNNLTGELPARVGALSKLEKLNLSDNVFISFFPSSIWNMKTLKEMNLSRNYLSFHLPFFSVSNLERLEVLELQHNNLTGKITPDLMNIPGLKKIDLSHNNLDGCFYEELMPLCDLGFDMEEGSVGYNFLHNPDLPNNGDFQAYCNNEIAGCENQNNRRRLDSLNLVAIYNALDGPNWDIQWDLSQPINTWGGILLHPYRGVTGLLLSHNNLSGELPEEIGNFKYLTYLFLSNNNIRGSFPESISNAAYLEEIDLRNNELKSLPENIARLKLLKKLYLSNNQIEGALSADIGYLNYLEVLDLSSNLLSGELPESLGRLRNIQRINLANNQFLGCYPASYTAFCDVNANFEDNNLQARFSAFCGQGTAACNTNLIDCPRLEVNVRDASPNMEDGAIFLSIIGGVAPFQVVWNTGDTTQNLENIPSGKYSVNVSNAQGCEVSSIGDLLTVESNDELPIQDVMNNISTLSVNEFSDDAIVEGRSSINSICINIEHSYLRDLEISLICPNGQAMILHEYPGRLNSRTVFLGEPIEEDGNFIEPGIGYDYCWRQEEGLLTWIEHLGDQFSHTLPAGDYAAFGDFVELIGCPLNGDWKLSIEDLWDQDNGTLFSWNLQLYNGNIQDSIVVGTRENGQQISARNVDLSNTVFEIYPNPSSGNLTFDFDLASDAILQILDAQGKVLEIIQIVEGEHQMHKDWSSMPKGIYYCRLQTVDRVWTKKLFLTR